MAVKFYDKGENKSGFVGFRVIGFIAQQGRMKNFSLEKYSYLDAMHAAYELDRKWEKESDEVKALMQKNRSEATTLSNLPFSNIVKLVALANEAGILSTWHLTVFLECAQQEGRDLYSIFGHDSNDEAYKRVYGGVRQLMHGESSRKAGLSLLDWGESTQGKVKAIILTHKGYELFSKMKALL